MKKLIITIALAMMASAGIFAQSVKREGNTFVEQKTERKSGTQATKTAYTFKAKDGKTYPIYLSKNGKAFIIRTSKKTGKEYRQYLPEITKQITKNN